MEAFIDSSVAYMLDNNMEDMMPDAFGIPDEPLNMSDFDDELDKEIYGEDEVATRRAKLIAEEHEELEIVKKLGEQMASELTDKVGTKRGREDEGGSGVSMADGTSHQVKKLEGRSGGLPYRARWDIWFCGFGLGLLSGKRHVVMIVRWYPRNKDLLSRYQWAKALFYTICPIDPWIMMITTFGFDVLLCEMVVKIKSWCLGNCTPK